MRQRTAEGYSEFIYQGPDMGRTFGSTRLQMERDENGKTKVQYTMGAGLEAMRRADGGDIASGDSSFYHYNHLGTTVALTNAAESVSDTYRHDAWGVRLASAGSTVNPHTYVGRERYFRMPEPNLYHLGFRDYAQRAGRFTTVGPIRYGANWFTYVRNCAPLLRDPAGLQYDYPESWEGALPPGFDRRPGVGGPGPIPLPGLPSPPWWGPPTIGQDEIDAKLCDLMECLAQCGYWEEYYLLSAFDIRVVNKLPGVAAWTNPLTGTVYVEEWALDSPGGLFAVLAHEAQHLHDIFVGWWPCWFYTHRFPRRTDEEMSDDYRTHCSDI